MKELMKRLLAVSLSIILAFASCACGTESGQSLIVSNQDNGTVKDAENSNVDKQETLLVDDDCIKAEFVEFSEYDSMGVFYVTIRVKNKTEKTIIIYLDEATVNNEMVPMVMSGVPLKILPEKTGANAFIFSFAQLSISAFEDVDTVAFKILVMDDNGFTEIEKTDEVVITK